MERLEHCPMVSVVMPAFQCENYVGAAVESVLAQSWTDWELLIVDDGSTDATCAILADYAQRDDRIRVLRHETNQGVAVARNTGIAAAKGRYIALLDSDDLWLPGKLAAQLALAEKSGADILYCGYGMIDEAGQKKHRDFAVPAETDFSHMLTENVISCSTALVRAQVLKQTPFRADFYHEDYALWLELLRGGCTAAGVTGTLALYRIVPGSRAHNKCKSAHNRWRIYRDALDMPLLKSCGCFLGYALKGIKKYWN